MPRQAGWKSTFAARTRRAARHRSRTLLARCIAPEVLEARAYLAAHIAGDPTVYSTIQAAVNAAASGGTIDVDAGMYSELVTISKPLTVRGAQAGVDARSNVRRSAAESIVNGTSTSDGKTSGFYIAASDVTIDGFTVQGNTSSLKYGAGIVIAPGKAGTHIFNNIVQNNVAGLYLANSSSSDPAVIQFNVFRNNNNSGTNSGRGVYSDGTVAGGKLQNVMIDANAFYNNHASTNYESGVGLESRYSTSGAAQSNIRVTNNVFDNNGKAVLSYNISNLTISGNAVTHEVDSASAAFRFEGGATNVTITGNTVYNSTADAIRVDSKAWGVTSSGFVVTNNNFFGNSTSTGSKESVNIGSGQYSGTFDARNNWWGNASGPAGVSSGTGDLLTANGSSVLYSPWLSAPTASLQNAYWGVAASTTATIEAEDYDFGYEGVGYHDIDKSNSGGVYRSDGVDLVATADSSGGYQVNDTRPGEWLAYTVNVPQSGSYTLSVRVATSQTTGGNFHVEVDGQNVTGTMSVPGTGGGWQTITLPGVNLSAGTRAMRLAMDTGGTSGTVGNFNWLKFSPDNTVPPSPPPPVFPPPPPPASGTTYLSDLAWLSATNGYGPVEKDTSNGSSGTGDGKTITLNGTTYAKGLGVHAASDITYALNGSYSSFTSDVGVDDEVGANGSVDFQVFADGVKIYDSGVLTGSSPTANINVNVSGVQQLRLVVTDGGDGIDYDHADWAGARLTAGAVTVVAPAAPTNLAASAVSSAQVKLTWSDNASNEAGYKIERSTDGVNFTQIGTTAADITAYTDATASAATAYSYRIRAAGSGGVDSDYSNVASVTTPAAPNFVYLSDLAWTSATNGWGPVEKDSSNGSSGTGDGKTITLNGATYGKGLGVHAASEVIYNLNGAYSQFLSDVGVDDEVGSNGTVVFQVYCDGVKVFDSGVMTGSSATKQINLSVAGVNQLRLVVTDSGDGNSYDHSDWAGARLVLAQDGTPTPTAPAAPTGLSATLSADNATVSLTWADNANNENSYRIDRSTDGVSFTTIATLALNATSYTDTALVAGTTYTYRVAAVNSVGAATSNLATVTVPSAAQVPPTTALPTGWTDSDVGNTGSTGSASYSNGTFTVKGAGSQISSKADSFNYASQSASGDMTVVAHVLSMDNTSADAMAGIMIRESLATNAKQVGVYLTPTNGVRFARRTMTGGDTTKTDFKGITAPHWVKLTRRGSTFTAYESSDGVNWTQVGSVTCDMSTNVYVGLAVTSHKTNTLNTAKFDNVSVVQGVL